MNRPDYANALYRIRMIHGGGDWNDFVGDVEGLASDLNDYIDYLEQQLDAAPMRSLQDELADVIAEACLDPVYSDDAAKALLEKFDITPKAAS